MLKTLRDTAHLFDRRIGWSRLGAVLASPSSSSLWSCSIVLREIDPDSLIDRDEATDWRTLIIAGAFVGAGYLTLTFYDLFALRTIGRTEIPYRIAALAGFTSYAIGHNVGASVFSGGAVRYRIYSAGLERHRGHKNLLHRRTDVLARQCHVLGLGVLYSPRRAPCTYQLPLWSNRVLALVVLAMLGAYVAWVWVKPRVIGRDGWRVSAGRPLTLIQIAIGIVDLACCAAAMYMLCPTSPISASSRSR